MNCFKKGSIPTSKACSQLQRHRPLKAKLWLAGATKASNAGNPGGGSGAVQGDPGLVIGGPPAPQATLADFRGVGRRHPQFLPQGRLDIVVGVQEQRRGTGPGPVVRGDDVGVVAAGVVDQPDFGVAAGPQPGGGGLG